MRVREWVRSHTKELSKFGTVGVAGVVVDFGVFNLLVAGHTHDSTRVVIAKIVAGAVAVIFAWLSHRWWTFKDFRALHPGKELAMFVVVNAVAVAIQAVVVWIGTEIMGLTTPVAINVVAYGVGLPLGTIARYIGYKKLVFTGRRDALAGGDA